MRGAGGRGAYRLDPWPLPVKAEPGLVDTGDSSSRPVGAFAVLVAGPVGIGVGLMVLVLGLVVVN